MKEYKKSDLIPLADKQLGELASILIREVISGNYPICFAVERFNELAEEAHTRYDNRVNIPERERK